MKALAGAWIPDEFANEFVRLLRWFDESHPGSTIQDISDVALPVCAEHFLSTCARLPPGRRLIRAASTAIATKWLAASLQPPWSTTAAGHWGFQKVPSLVIGGQHSAPAA